MGFLIIVDRYLLSRIYEGQLKKDWRGGEKKVEKKVK